MSDHARIVGFEDLWRAIGGRRVFASPAGWPGSLDRARLGRIARHAPEVVVKMAGVAATRRRLREHLHYISRGGDLPLETSEGERLMGRAAPSEIAADWAWGAAVSSRDTVATPIARSVVLSAPPGSDRDAVTHGVRAFCTRMLGGLHEFVWVRHEDTPNPHAHLLVRTLGSDGRTFSLGKSELWNWREAFAASLRERGLEVEATPRRARGATLRSERSAYRYLRRDYEEGRASKPKALGRAQDEAARLARGDGADLRPWEEAQLARRREIRAAFARAAKVLDGSNDPADRELAEQVRNFLRDMPAAHTKRFLLARQAQALELRTAIDRDRLPARSPSRELER